MTRTRGFENICNELGYVGEFYTLTAPSKYHATTKAGYLSGKGPRNRIEFNCEDSKMQPNEK